MKRAIAALAGFAVLATATAGATVLLPADLGDLSREAVAIVRGRVVAVDARWTTDRRGIETRVTIEAETYLKGGLGTIVQVRVPGGRLGRYRNLVVGAPEFAPGQRVVLFLGGRAPALPHILGLGQGVYRVFPRDAGWVVTPPAVMPLAGSGSTPGQPVGPVTIVRGDPARASMPLATFEARVRALAEATP